MNLCFESASFVKMSEKELRKIWTGNGKNDLVKKIKSDETRREREKK